MNKNFYDLIIELGIISQAKTGEKYCIALKKYQDSNSYLTSILRTYYRENKDTYLSYLHSVIIDAVTILDKNEIEEKELRILINSISESIKGMENIKETYKDRPDFVSKINTWIQLLKLKTNVYEDISQEES